MTIYDLNVILVKTWKKYTSALNCQNQMKLRHRRKKIKCSWWYEKFCYQNMILDPKTSLMQYTIKGGNKAKVCPLFSDLITPSWLHYPSQVKMKMAFTLLKTNAISLLDVFTTFFCSERNLSSSLVSPEKKNITERIKLSKPHIR